MQASIAQVVDTKKRRTEEETLWEKHQEFLSMKKWAAFVSLKAVSQQKSPCGWQDPLRLPASSLEVVLTTFLSY